MLKIQGYITNIIFRNSENFYTVAVLETTDGELTVVGVLPSDEIGTHYELQGDMVYHDKYGEQFSIETALIVLPQTTEAIEKYLASGILPHIGKKTAKRIVKKFGDQALEIMENQPERLAEIKGLGEVKIRAISQAMEDQGASRNSILFLQEMGFGTNQAMRIYKEYGDQTVNAIKSNPYRLIEDIQGIGFRIADRTALQSGFNKESLERILAGLKYTLDYSARQNGDTYIDKENFIQMTTRLLEVSSDLISKAIDGQVMNGKLIQKKLGDREVIYNEKLYLAEDLTATRVLQMIKSPPKWEDIDFQGAFEKSVLDDDQKKAVMDAFSNKVIIITGGPGTGKTMVVNTIVDVAERNNISVLLAAPTGRAAKKMEEASERAASTIHRMLKYSQGDDGFQSFDHDRDNPLEADMIIIDEASMLDIDLMSKFIDAVTSVTSLVLVGDVDQLPSVGPGNVLKDLIKSAKVKVRALVKIYRQDESSTIVTNAHRINNGLMPIFKGSKDFFFVDTPSMEASPDVLIDLVKRRLANYYDLDPKVDIQVLSIMKKGDLGTWELNKRLQEALNPAKDENHIEYGDVVFRLGDKVMQQKNNYNLKTTNEDGQEDLGVFNGDMGTIVDLDAEKIQMKVEFDDKRTALYAKENIAELMHSYSITIHKSQGSEFPLVLVPIHPGPYMLLTRNLIYTAVTRAKDKVVLVGDRKTLQRMVENDNISQRNSSLDIRLQEKARLFEGVL